MMCCYYWLLVFSHQKLFDAIVGCHTVTFIRHESPCNHQDHLKNHVSSYGIWAQGLKAICMHTQKTRSRLHSPTSRRGGQAGSLHSLRGYFAKDKVVLRYRMYCCETRCWKEKGGLQALMGSDAACKERGRAKRG